MFWLIADKKPPYWLKTKLLNVKQLVICRNKSISIYRRVSHAQQKILTKHVLVLSNSLLIYARYCFLKRKNRVASYGRSYFVFTNECILLTVVNISKLFKAVILKVCATEQNCVAKISQVCREIRLEIRAFKSLL